MHFEQFTQIHFFTIKTTQVGNVQTEFRQCGRTAALVGKIQVTLVEKRKNKVFNKNERLFKCLCIKIVDKSNNLYT